ncbi:hypothetical protein QZH41_011732 [Actinostola sp. cb2023]|nr:hypothetical protein QZH41_011732 [Actinostola sp. cb2023]
MTLMDQQLLTKLSRGGDLVALEAKYHATCLAKLYRKAQTSRYDDNGEENIVRLEGIALAELVAYIEESTLTIFKLADLAKAYKSRTAYKHTSIQVPEQLDVNMTARVNTTRLKERLLIHLPGLEDHNNGRDVYLAFKDDLGRMMEKAHQEDCDEEAIHLAKAASIVRKEILAMKYSFDGSFDSDCQTKSVPESLLSLVNMILYGPNIEAQTNTTSSAQVGLTIAQFMQFNSYNRRRDQEVKREQRNKYRETPLAIYTGLLIHAKTRSRDLIETMHSLGISISYDRVLAISTALGNELCRRYEEDNVVCPPNLRLGVFTTSAVDNIDHNPTSTTARDSFHGTGISIFQSITSDVPGTTQARVAFEEKTTTSKSVAELPKPYTEVIPAVLQNKSPPVPETHDRLDINRIAMVDAFQEEVSWLKNVEKNLINEESLEEGQLVSWAAYHSTTDQQQQSHSPAISALLPLFPDQAKSVAMNRHAMNVIKECVHHLNPGQVPVIAMDQPLYTVAKQIQWNWPDQYGEQKFVIMFGGLHIEMAFLKAIGGWLEDSGWVAAIVDANVASSGTAESFIKATSVTRSRRAHQVTASSLYMMPCSLTTGVTNRH